MQPIDTIAAFSQSWGVMPATGAGAGMIRSGAISG